MKIVIATAVYYPMINGVAVFSHNLAMGLAMRGNEVMVLCPSQTGKNYTRTIDGVKTLYLKSVQAKVYPDQIHDVPPKKKFMGKEWPRLLYKHGFRISVFPQREIRKALNDFEPDVVHVQISDPIGLSVVSYARKNNIPVVTTEHNQPEVITDPLGIPNFMKKPADALLTAYLVNRQGKSDYVTMPTKLAIQKFLGSKEFNVPIEAVSNGVDLSCFKPGEADAETYKKYNIPMDHPIVLYVGRVDPEKKVDLIVEAFSSVIKKIPDAILVVVGDGVDRLNLEKKAQELNIFGSTRFLGRVIPPDLYELYKIGDVFATASTIETQGIVLIEAAAAGLPLVAVDAGAVAEVCINNENGFLVTPGDVSAISKSIIAILKDDKMRGEFSRNSIRVAHEHDFDKTLDKFMEIYRYVVKEKGTV